MPEETKGFAASDNTESSVNRGSLEGVVFRRGSEEDLPQIMDLEVAVFSGEQEIPESDVRGAQTDRTMWWVAACGSRIIGAAAAWEEAREGLTDGRKAVHGARFIMDPAWRGCGLGARMSLYMLREIFRMGYDMVYMENRDVTVHIVEKYGAVRCGEPYPFYVGMVTPMILTREAFEQEVLP